MMTRLFHLTKLAKQALERQLARLPQPARERLMTLKASYPTTPLKYLPLPVRAEVKQLLASAIAQPPRPDAEHPLHNQPVPPLQAQHPLPQGHRHTGQTRPIPASVSREWERLVTVLGTDATTGREIGLTLAERFTGNFVIGSTGTGKTTLDLNMTLSDIRQGFGVCLIEPHGDRAFNMCGDVAAPNLYAVVQ